MPPYCSPALPATLANSLPSIFPEILLLHFAISYHRVTCWAAVLLIGTFLTTDGELDGLSTLNRAL